MNGFLELRGLALTLKLGAHGFERLETRRVPVDIFRSGNLFSGDEPAVDYSLVCSLLRTGLKEEYLYIEELACDILKLLKDRWEGEWRITVHKIHPPVDPPIAEASVTIEG